MRRYMLMLCLSVFPSLLYSQTQWVLQEYLHRIGKNANEYLGQYVSGIGDFNRDGKPDVAASQFGATGLWYITNNTDTVPQRIFFGTNLVKGDINGDGYTDFVLSNNDTVCIYWGTLSDIDTTNPTRLYAEHLGDAFGRVMCIGNLIGDAVSDLVITAQDYPGFPVIGKVYIYRGGLPFDTIPAYTITGDSGYYRFGTNCAIGDINNYGFNDLAVSGSFSYGQTCERWHYLDVYFGSVTFDTVRDFRIRNSCDNLGDVKIFDANGDGKKDLLWATRDSSNGIYIYFGRVNFTLKPDMILRPPYFFETFFSRIIDAGDMDGDGYHDIAVSDPGAFQGSGFVLIYRGGAALDTVWDAGKGRSDGSKFGVSMDIVGDINGDGLSDIVIGAPAYAFGTNQGYFGIFLGDRQITAVGEKPTSTLPQIARLEQNYPNPFNPIAIIKFGLPA
ncbi:MAG: hypothetical protein C0417_05375 [Chlorobiaceae bacterium]|nr:hypothetical protein [Chlorobiaceae bacterium]